MLGNFPAYSLKVSKLKKKKWLFVQMQELSVGPVRGGGGSIYSPKPCYLRRGVCICFLYFLTPGSDSEPMSDDGRD